MRKHEAPPPNLRNGLKWRGGQPRWEPSPTSRKLGIKGCDLKRPDGRWMNRGEAIEAADSRQLWAAYIRDAHKAGRVGEDARGDLREALEQLGDKETPERDLVEDLMHLARALLNEDAPIAATPEPEPDRTVAALVSGYFTALENREPYFVGQDGELTISAATIENYRGAGRALVSRFGAEQAAGLTRGQMREWYDELRRAKSLAMANQRLGCSSAFFKWGSLQNPPWLTESPCVRLGRSKDQGRRVFWEIEEEQPFEAWCDENGFPDVADGMIAGIWTGARINDLCSADLEDLRGETWRFIPHKNRRRTNREALPGIASPFRKRIDRRWREVAEAKVTQAGGRPFLVNPVTSRRHTTKTLGERFREAKAAALLAGAVPASIEEKKGQDWRDTCITRLWDADVGLDRIPAWTGHSPDEASTILRDHYLALRDKHALETLRRLHDYMQRQGVKV